MNLAHYKVKLSAMNIAHYKVKLSAMNIAHYKVKLSAMNADTPLSGTTDVRDVLCSRIQIL